MFNVWLQIQNKSQIRQPIDTSRSSEWGVRGRELIPPILFGCQNRLDLTPEIEVFHMLSDRCHTKNRTISFKQHIKYLNIRSYDQLDVGPSCRKHIKHHNWFINHHDLSTYVFLQVAATDRINVRFRKSGRTAWCKRWPWVGPCSTCAPSASTPRTLSPSSPAPTSWYTSGVRIDRVERDFGVTDYGSFSITLTKHT